MINIAIDGPSGAGKSWLSKSLARELGFIHVDTGAMYRSIGLYVLRHGVDADDKEKIVAMLPDISVELAFKKDGQHIYLCGEDVTSLIRTPDVSMYASAVSAIPEVRCFLLEQQRDLASKNNVVMDGRDIGTVILPHAHVKIFLTAKSEVRARRRCAELCEKDKSIIYDDVLSDMLKRDKNDAEREIAPAIPASDAVILDNSDLNPEQTLAAAIDIVKVAVTSAD